jgi:hypothetical protein
MKADAKGPNTPIGYNELPNASLIGIQKNHDQAKAKRKYKTRFLSSCSSLSAIRSPLLVLVVLRSFILKILRALNHEASRFSGALGECEQFK